MKRRFFLCLVGASLLSCSPIPPPGAREVLWTEIPAMSSYVSEYANSSRNSRVHAAVRAGYELSFVTDLRRSPESILLSPSGSQVVIVTRSHLDLWSGGRMTPSFTHQPSGCRAAPVVMDDGLRIGLRHIAWNGAKTGSHMSAMDSENAFELAAWAGPGVDVSVAQNLGTLQSPFEMSVQAKTKSPGGAKSRWTFSIPGRGTGAVLPDGRVAVASRTGRLTFLSATGDHATSSAIPLFEVETGLPIYALSFTEAGLVALFAEGSLQDAEMLGLPPPGRLVPGAWTSGIACFDVAGAERWRARVPFGASGPAVDAAGGRVVVVGRGIAALEDGNVVWSSAGEVPSMATAFRDGSLAVSVGSELRVLDRDGRLVTRLASPADPGAPDTPGKPFVTPPAVAADGSIWIATAERLFVAR